MERDWVVGAWVRREVYARPGAPRIDLAAAPDSSTIFAAKCEDRGRANPPNWACGAAAAPPFSRAMPSLDERYQAIIKRLSADVLLNEVFVFEKIEPIAREGHADAAMMMSLIRAIGYGCERDWPAALEWAPIAAERGVEAARAQLRFLASADDDDWRGLAARVDVGAWTAAREGRLVNERPWISLSEGFLDARACAWMIARAAPLQTQSLVYDPITGKAAQADVRTNTCATFTILTLDLPTLLIRERIANTVGVPIEHLERVSVFRYTPGQQFASHVDYLTPSPQLNAEIAEIGQRPFTFLVYLNEAFEGGETHFLDIDKKFRGRTGDALFWRNTDESGAPDLLTTHAGVAPVSGEKWLLSQFIRDKAQLLG
ncbi:MAG: 2OG-Fe(II) oxygenase [Hyphomonadaceae bacterium]